jgi:hypothetical protein
MLLAVVLGSGCAPSGSRLAVEPGANLDADVVGTGGQSGKGGGSGGASSGGSGGSASGGSGGSASGGQSGSSGSGGASSGGSGGSATGGSGGAGSGGSGGSAMGGSGGSGGSGGTAPRDAAPDQMIPRDMAPPPPDMAPPPPPDMAPPSTLTNGLVSRWKLDETTGTTTEDSGPAGNDATLKGGATWLKTGCFPAAKYANPGCVRIDGSDDLVELGLKMLPTYNKPMTLSLWVTYTSVTSNNQVFIAFTDEQNNGARLKFGLKAGDLAAWRSDSVILASVAAPAADAWHHVVYTYDGRTHTLYVDGTMRDTSTQTTDTGTVSSARLGTLHTNTERLKGDLDEVRVYSRALTAAEVMELHTGME